MDHPDSYKSIKNKSDVEIKIKGSKFIGRARPCLREKEAEDRLTFIRKKYYDATHNCFAFRLGLGKYQTFRYSDDGEPSGTAGKPIFDQIEGHDLTNTLVIVTRYFGGTKLGTGGLARAYSEAAGAALEAAEIIEKFITRNMIMTVAFPDYNQVERIIRQLGGHIIGADFKEKVALKVEIRLSLVQKLKESLINATAGRIIIA
jgi:uncharacterized YigZ family protein